ncbi:GroES-like protein [Dentipellis sp. KUC8613]|nr:GroES-like protein [Dentipellis sp. KUC8613]
MTIPRTQTAALIVTPGQPLEVRTTHPVPQPETLEPGQCLVRMHCTGVCHSDLHIAAGEWQNGPVPFIGGHEGVGTVVAMGPGTAKEGEGDVRVGTRVGVKWILYACGRCELCRKGDESVCESRKRSGYTNDGTFCQYMVAWINHVVPIPEGLSDENAAPILCAGLTVYAALKRSNTSPSDWVVIPGAGGGLGHLAIQYATALGLRVLAIDTGNDKKEVCLQLGAEKWIDFKESKDPIKDIVAACDGKGPHAALITTASGKAYQDSIHYLRTRGTVIVIGVPDDFTWGIPPGIIMRKGIRIVGHALGNYQDTVEALDLAARSKVVPHVNVKKLADINEVFNDMREGKIVGRTVIPLQ